MQTKRKVSETLERRRSPRLQTLKASSQKPSPATSKPCPEPEGKLVGKHQESEGFSFSTSDHDAVINSILRQVAQSPVLPNSASQREQTSLTRSAIRRHRIQECGATLLPHIDDRAILTAEDGVGKVGNFPPKLTNEDGGTQNCDTAASSDSIAPEQTTAPQSFMQSNIAVERPEDNACNQYNDSEQSISDASPRLGTVLTSNPQSPFDPLPTEPSAIPHTGHQAEFRSGPGVEIRDHISQNSVFNKDISTSATTKSPAITDAPPLPCIVTATEHTAATNATAVESVVEEQREQMVCRPRKIGSSHTSHSFGLTEILEMGADEDSNSDEAEYPGIATVHGYKVKEELAPMLEKIFMKYGDITERCILLNPDIRSSILEEVCKIIQAFQGKKFVQLALDEIQEAISKLEDFRRARLDVSWLQQRLENFSEAKQLIKQSSLLKLKEKRDESTQVIRKAREELKCYKAEMTTLEEKMSAAEKELAAALVDAAMVEKTVMKVKHCVENPLLDDIF